MGLQARLSSSDPRLYSCDRDIAHCFANMVTVVAQRLEEGHWPYLEAFLKKEGVTMDQLGHACQVFGLYAASPASFATKDPGKALADVGWFYVPEAAQVAYMAILGTVTLGYAHVGIRDATLGGQGPALTSQELHAGGEAAARVLAWPRWRRWLLRQRLQVSRLLTRKPTG